MNRQNIYLGFSLIEVTIALGVASFCLIAVFGLLPVALQTNRNAVAQTAAANILSAVTADIRATPITAASSAQFAISFGTPQTLFFDADGRSSPSQAATSLYRLAIEFPPGPGGTFQASSSFMRISWPAAVDPSVTTPAGSLEIFAAFDRH